MSKDRDQVQATHFELLVQNGVLPEFLHQGERALMGAQFRALRNRPKLGLTLDAIAEQMLVPTQKMAGRQFVPAAVRDIILAFEAGELNDVTLEWLQCYARVLKLVYGHTLTDATSLTDTQRYNRITGK